jgi:hypothetical protein
MTKPIVQYDSMYFFGFTDPIGHSVFVMPVDHPGSVSNGKLATTSAVQSYDETTGIFETKNTVYVPASALDKKGKT